RLSNALFSLADRVKMIAETDWALLLTHAQARLRRTSVPTHDEPRAVAGQRMLAALYGNHPYGRRIGIPDLLALDPERAAAGLPRLYNPLNAFLVIVGDFDPNVAAWLVSGWFGSWQAKADAGRLAPPPVPAPTPRPAPEVIIAHRPVASQVEVAF